MLNYLKITGLKVGVILNFRRAKLEWERMVLESGRENDQQGRINAKEREFRI